MRKYIIFLLLAFLFIIAGCHDSHHFINVDVYAIAKEKYGEVQPIIKNINFFKYLENDLPDIDGLDYLISKSVSYYDTIPENLNPLMFNMDLVIHDNKYQLLIYNRTIRESDDKYKMVLLNDWFFDVSIIDIINALDDNQITFGAPNEWQMEVIKKPANPYPNVLWGSLIDMVYFEEDSKVLVYLNYLRSNFLKSSYLILSG
jgi:hypothetical protein